MGVYIDMEMPKACLACEFCNPFTEEPYCRRLMKVTPKTTTLPDCPIIEIPEPHGRLIDADALSAELPAPIEDEYKHVRRIIEIAPTIIPASEEGE